MDTKMDDGDPVVDYPENGNGNELDVEGTFGDDEREKSPEKSTEKRSGKETTDGELTQNNDGKKRHQSRRKNKGGKHHQKKWKPYSKMTWDERQELEERESQKAKQRMEKRMAEGHPVAPSNTTQFIMNDHFTDEQLKPALNANNNGDHPMIHMLPCHQTSRDGSGGGSLGDSSDAEFYESPNDEDIFLAKDFSDTYANIHAERLQSLSKEDLVKDYIDMECKVERLETLLKVSEENKTNDNITTNMDSNENKCVPVINSSDRLSAILNEVQRLRSENTRLLTENDDLKSATRLPFQNYAT